MIAFNQLDNKIMIAGLDSTRRLYFYGPAPIIFVYTIGKSYICIDDLLLKKQYS